MEVGELVLPLFIRRSTSIIEPGDYGTTHNNSLTVDVEWQECNTTEQMKDVGIEEAITHNTTLIVKEEIRLPEEGAAEKDWTGKEDLHPFWLVKRQKSVTISIVTL